MEAGQRERVPGIQIRLRHDKKKAEIYQKAYEASQNDAERLCPGHSFTLGPGIETLGIDLKARMEDLTRNIEQSQREVEPIQDWIRQLPYGADRARKLAQDASGRVEKYIEAYMDQRRGVALALAAVHSVGG